MVEGAFYQGTQIMMICTDVSSYNAYTTPHTRAVLREGEAARNSLSRPSAVPAFARHMVQYVSAVRARMPVGGVVRCDHSL